MKNKVTIIVLSWLLINQYLFAENYNLKDEMTWENTGLIVKSEDQLFIRMDGGDRKKSSYRNSNGINAKSGDLIGKVGNHIFTIGDEVNIKAEDEGTLYVRRNYSASSNGYGTITIDIKSGTIPPVIKKTNLPADDSSTLKNIVQNEKIEELDNKVNYFIGEFFKNLDSAVEKDIERWNNQINEISEKISQNEQNNENEIRRQKVIGGKKSSGSFGGEKFNGQNNNYDARSLSTNLKDAKEKLNIYQILKESSKKNREDLVRYYKTNIDKTTDKAEVSRRMLDGMYVFYGSIADLCKNVESTSSSDMVINKFLKDVESMEWFKKPKKSSETNNSIPENEEDFLNKFGNKIRHQTKFVSRHGTSNTYWIGNNAINYDDGKLSSIYQSN